MGKVNCLIVRRERTAFAVLSYFVETFLIFEFVTKRLRQKGYKIIFNLHIKSRI